MENMIVSGALVVVILLLFLVVYENSTFLRGIGSRLGRIVKRRKEDDAMDEEDAGMVSIATEENTERLGIGSRLGRLVKWWKKDEAGDEEDAGIVSMAAEENIFDDEPPHPDPLEAALERISRLEEGMAKVSEDTEGISEDMKDVVGALRSSIDGLTSRLDQVDGAMEDIHLTVDPLPQNVQDATGKSDEISKRLEDISSDLQRTLGYAIQKTFKCESCSSEGLVASQVLCSKCGKESWWGWWPTNEDSVENEVESEGNPVEKIEG